MSKARLAKRYPWRLERRSAAAATSGSAPSSPSGHSWPDPRPRHSTPASPRDTSTGKRASDPAAAVGCSVRKVVCHLRHRPNGRERGLHAGAERPPRGALRAPENGKRQELEVGIMVARTQGSSRATLAFLQVKSRNFLDAIRIWSAPRRPVSLLLPEPWSACG